MNERVKKYLRAVAKWIADDGDDEGYEQELIDAKDDAWDELTTGEQDQAYQLVDDVFGELI